MKILLISIIGLFFLTEGCNAQELKCKEFHQGTFINAPDGKSTGTIIKRNEIFQIEIHEERGLETKDMITWLDDCTYKLSPVDKNQNNTNLIVKITETTGNYCLLTLWVEGEPDKILKTKMIRIE